MDIELTYDYPALQRQIDLLTYYRGEAAKREDVNADLQQTSEDNADVLKGFLATACNNAAALCAKRMVTVDYSLTDTALLFHLSPTHEENVYLVPLLKKALEDYLVNHCIYEWMLTMREEWALTYLHLQPACEASLEKIMAMLYRRRVRRRSTDLAGI